MICGSGCKYKLDGIEIKWIRKSYGFWPITLTGSPYKRLTKKSRETLRKFIKLSQEEKMKRAI